MGKAQDGQKRKTANDAEGTKYDKVTDPRQILEDLLRRTEEMEKRLSRILEDCENLAVFDDSRSKDRFRPRFFGR
jgi:hypothetical protein